MSFEATWGNGGREFIDSVGQLDALLDRIDSEARSDGRPQEVQLSAPEGDGTLGVVLGHERSVLSYVPADGNPPYLTSVGDEDEDRPFTFYAFGNHHSESHWRHTIRADVARQAARTFLLTQSLDSRVRWAEV